MSKLRQMADIFRKLDKKQVGIGWFEENRYADGKPVAEVAYLNEVGHTTKFKKGNMPVEAVFVTPARPFMRATAIAAEEPVREVSAKLAKGVAMGKITPDQSLQMIGEKVLGELLNQIKNGGWEPNSDLTVNGLPPLWEGKGFNSPLTGVTGLMAQSAQAKVIKK